MRGIDGIEGKILKKYIKVKIIDPKDRAYLERMHNTGLVNIKYDFVLREDTVRTTNFGYSSIF